MKYTTNIDNISAMEWGLSIQQAYIMDWIMFLPTWAEKVIIGSEIFYFASRFKAADDLPLLSEKADTIYRYYKQLEAMSLIKLKKIDGKDYVTLLEKTKTWGSIKEIDVESLREKLGKKSENSEKNPSKLGKKSENNSENFPTYYNTNIDNNTINTKQGAEKKTETEKIQKPQLSKSEVKPSGALIIPDFTDRATPPPTPQSILGRLTALWLAANPEYKELAHPQQDTPAIRRICAFLMNTEQFHAQEEKTIERFKQFIAVVKAHDFYKDKPLKTISNNIQTFAADLKKAALGKFIVTGAKNISTNTQYQPPKVVLTGTATPTLLNGGAKIKL